MIFLKIVQDSLCIFFQELYFQKVVAYMYMHKSGWGWVGEFKFLKLKSNKKKVTEHRPWTPPSKENIISIGSPPPEKLFWISTWCMYTLYIWKIWPFVYIYTVHVFTCM